MSDVFDISKYAGCAFKQKHLLTLKDYSREEILCVLATATDLKAKLKKGIMPPILANMALAMIFAKPSTRTRVSFEVGIRQLGGYSLFLSSQEIQLGRGEPVSDTAQVLSRYVDAIMIRTFKQEDLEELALHSTIPVINGLTDLFHPCQALADILTVFECKNRFSGIKLAYIGDGNNVANSLMIICAKLGIDISLACPEGYSPVEDIVSDCKKYANESGSRLEITKNPQMAAENADFIYTDVWTSMGQEAEQSERLEIFRPYQVNEELFSHAKSDARFLHCLPAHRGEEVSADIIDSPKSLVFEQAENRLHVQKAVMALLMRKLNENSGKQIE